MRVFVSIEFDEHIKDYLEDIQDKLRKKSLKGRFHPRDNFHLTLKFIGEVDEEKIEDIKNAIDKSVLDKEVFKLTLKKLGRFPKKSRDIIWIGIYRSIKLELLFCDLEEELSKINIEKEERDFNSHITLGRNIRLEEKFEEVERQILVDNLEIEINEISLMESKNINGKLKYIPIYQKKL